MRHFFRQWRRIVWMAVGAFFTGLLSWWLVLGFREAFPIMLGTLEEFIWYGD